MRRRASISFRSTATGSSKSRVSAIQRHPPFISATTVPAPHTTSTSRTKTSLGRIRRAVAARTRSGAGQPFDVDDQRDPAVARVRARALPPASRIASRPSPSTGSRISTARTARSRTTSSGVISAHDQTARVSRRARTCPARAASHRPRPARRNRRTPRETRPPRPCRFVLEQEHRHAIPALRLERAQACDDAGDGAVRF